jgi:ATP-dependent Lon protease
MEKKFRKPVSEILLPDMLDGEGDIIPIIADGDDGELEDVDIPESIPILSLRNTVLFPGVVLPISIGRPRSIQLIKDAYRGGKIVGTVAQKDPEIENPEFRDLHTVGTIGLLLSRGVKEWFWRNLSQMILILLQG